MFLLKVSPLYRMRSLASPESLFMQLWLSPRLLKAGGLPDCLGVAFC